MSEKARETIQDAEIEELNLLIQRTITGVSPNRVTTIKSIDQGQEIIIATKID